MYQFAKSIAVKGRGLFRFMFALAIFACAAKVFELICTHWYYVYIVEGWFPKWHLNGFQTVEIIGFVILFFALYEIEKKLIYIIHRMNGGL